MDDRREFVHEESAQLRFDFPLQEVAYERDGIEGGGNLERLEGVISEDDGDPFLLGEDEDDETRELEIGQGYLKRDCQRGPRGKRESVSIGRRQGHSDSPWQDVRSRKRFRSRKRRSGKEIGIQWVCLDTRFEGEKSISRVRHLEDAAKTVFGQVTDLEDLQLWRDRTQVELRDDDVVDDDGGFGGFVQSGG